MNKILHFKAQLNSTPERAFEMFTANDLVEPWLIKPFSPTGHAEIEARIGGRYELFWDPNSREDNSTIGCRITAIEPGKFLGFEWTGASQFKHFMNTADPLTHVLAFFIPMNDGAKRVTEAHLVHTGWRNTSEWEEARKWFEESWKSAFQKLEQHVNNPNAAK